MMLSASKIEVMRLIGSLSKPPMVGATMRARRDMS